MKQITAGIVAHVDAGKTTLSEALLYQAGQVRQLGRVDNGDAFLDTDRLEKKRGITIFSHQAQLTHNNLQLTLLDTPGHVDFAAQTEQTLSVLDYAILVISATDGVQGHTRTLWRLLKRYQVPTFVFVNKMDQPDVDKAKILEELQQQLASGCIAFDSTDESNGQLSKATYEEIALQDDSVLDEFLETDKLNMETVQKMIKTRQIFPCYFGAALKQKNITMFLNGLEQWTTELNKKEPFAARVFKISHDEQGERLTWVRVLGGTLHNKEIIMDDQKANQLRNYNGAKYDISQEMAAGGVCAITGLTKTYPGQGLGQAEDALKPMIQPVLTYAVDPKDSDIHHCLRALRILEDEDPQLHVTWSEQLQEIRVKVMGTIQLEVLSQLLLDRFNLDISFNEGGILYRETITATVEGVGHFEPLRHYSEVHLLLSPLPQGSGLVFESQCSTDILGKNWQHQVLTSLSAKQHLGVLIGAPLTDTKITLINGRSHIKHSEGGDFRQATWRAVRQGLMMLEQQKACELLEPWYQFRLEINQDQVGRAMNDIQKMNGEFETPTVNETNNMSILTGVAPVSEMQDYAREVNSYTHGQGQLECVVAGYRPCHNATEIIEQYHYQPVADLENTPDSVFCAHGAGYPVAWSDVPAAAHLPYANLAN